MAKTFCSGIPRMKMQVESCCEAHDTAYGPGGNGTRRQADNALYDCLVTERPLFAYVAWVTVRMVGWVFWVRK